MAKLVTLNFNPDAQTLRQFGFIALFAFGLLALAAWTESFMFSFGLGSARQIVSAILGGLAALCLIFSLVMPSGNRPIYVGLSVITYPIGFVMSYVVLGLLFFGIIGPMALVLRLVGKDPMARRYDPSAPSYWTRARRARSNQAYLRQF
jgi:hypothetical protein